MPRARGSFPSGRIQARFDDNGSRPKVGKIEIEFAGAIGRIQRRARGVSREGEKCHGHIGSIRTDQRDAITRLNAEFAPE